MNRVDDTSIELVLYRWRDNFYSEESRQKNDYGAVCELRKLFMEGL